MKLVSFLRSFLVVLVLFSSGLFTGWWLDNYFKVSGERESEANREIVCSPMPINQSKGKPEDNNVSTDEMQFSYYLTEGRFDDALVLYQLHQSKGGALESPLNKMLLSTVDRWRSNGDLEVCIGVLDRFTQHYYQNIEWLKVLADILEVSGDIDRAIDVSVMACVYSSEPNDQHYFNGSVHRMARHLFDSYQKDGLTEQLLTLFQRLANQEYGHTFYRYAVAQIFLALGDRDSAARELEALQFDDEFGVKASKDLAGLLPKLPNITKKVSSHAIPLTSVSGQHFLAPVTVGEKSTVNLLIDTGATLTTLPTRLLHELRQKKQASVVGHIELKTANGPCFSTLYSIKFLKIGPYTLKDIQVAELDLGANNSAAGLLGMNVLGMFAFQIDQDSLNLIVNPR